MYYRTFSFKLKCKDYSNDIKKFKVTQDFMITLVSVIPTVRITH